MAKKTKHREADLEFGPATDLRFKEIAKAVLANRSKPVKPKVGRKKRR
jgi:hypothetical protein